MAQVNISINGRSYAIACDDGQEGHLSRLGRYVDQRARELVSAVGQINEPLLLAMACLLIADELAEANNRLEKSAKVDDSWKNEVQQDLAEEILRLAKRISSVAEKLEKA